MASYWIIINGEKAGPYEQERLGAMGINPDTKVWNPTLSGWTPASEVAELAGIFPPPVPFEERMQSLTPIPQVFELEEPEQETEEEQKLPNPRLALSFVLSAVCPFLLLLALGHCCRPTSLLFLIMSIPPCWSPVLAPIFSVVCKVSGVRGKMRTARVMSRLALAFDIVMIVMLGITFVMSLYGMAVNAMFNDVGIR